MVAREMTEAAKKVLEKLGWNVKASKECPVAEVFTALGVRFDLSKATADPSFLSVSNKPERVSEMKKQFDEVLARNSLPAAEAARMRSPTRPPRLEAATMRITTPPLRAACGRSGGGLDLPLR